MKNSTLGRGAVFSFALVAWAVLAIGQDLPADAPVHDLLIRGGTIFDGSGGAAEVGDVVIDGDRIVYVGPARGDRARTVIEAGGKAVAPGFINMLSWAVESLIVDGRALSDLRQGVTLEVFGEGESMGPLNDEMKRNLLARQVDVRYDVPWTTLDEYLQHLERRGIAPNVASFIGAATPRIHELGEKDVDPTPEQLDRMRALVRNAMEDGALGVGGSLIYAPSAYAETDELVALVTEAGRCGGMYIAHIRSEGDRLLEAVDESIEIARRSGAPAEIYHLKMAGRDNWGKFDGVVERIDAARAQGLRITADMYTYVAGATGLDASMPTWVQDGGLEAWIERLRDPAIRARVIAEMRAESNDWENALRNAGGAEGVMLTGFRSEKLKPLIGKRLSEVAKMRGVSPEDAAIDLVIEDGTRVDATYFLMSEDNVRRQIALPYMSFGSDEAAPAPEGVFLKSMSHPRAYGNVARLLGHYVRDEKIITLSEAVRRLTSLPAGNLGLRERGRLKPGYFADVVVFDPATVQDHATFERPAQLATGVSHVVVNGGVALSNGEPTGAVTGRVVRGRAWRGWPDGGCRDHASDWSWNATPADPFDRARAVIRDVMNRENLPSVAVAVSRDGRVLWEEGFGWADIANRVPATQDTLYSLASISKPITATALMTLVESGAVDLERPIDDYLGATKLTAHVGNARDATVRRVANHTAGLSIHHQFFYEDEDRPRPTVDENIALHGHVMHPPGESFIYSNFGYGLLDHVIERASGRPYGDYLRDAVFEPLGMRRTVLDARPGPGANVAVRYAQDGSALPFYGFDAPGASAVFASAHDLLRFGMFHLGDFHGSNASPDTKPVLSRESLRDMHARAEYTDRPDDKKSGYGIGWGMGPFDGVDAIYHTGGMAGVSTSLVLIPEHDIALTVLVNAESDGVNDIEKAILAALLPELALVEREFKPEDGLVGAWRGVVKLPQGDLPVAMEFSKAGGVQVQVAGRPPVEVPQVSLIEKTIWLEYVPERLGVPEFERHPMELQFGLKRRGDVLTGEATTMSRPLPDRIGDAIGFFVRLERVGED